MRCTQETDVSRADCPTWHRSGTERGVPRWVGGATASPDSRPGWCPITGCGDCARATGAPRDVTRDVTRDFARERGSPERGWSGARLRRPAAFGPETVETRLT